LNILSKLIDKLYLKQWSIGIIEESIQNIIRNKKLSKQVSWIPINNKHLFYADPFIFKSISGEYSVLYEEMDYKKQYGNISLFILNNMGEVIAKKVILDTKSHLSYPFIFNENDKIYVFPESSASGKLSCYQYEENNQSLSFKKVIINLPLLDSTILKYQNRYWIFSTLKGDDSNKKLYIYFSDSLFGPYTPHPKNPVRDNINGSRPAGNFIFVDGNIYRPAQNSGKYYGSSIVITKIVTLNENEFTEKDYMILSPGKSDNFNFGFHTINYQDELVVIDGLRRTFAPLTQIITFIRKNRIIKIN